MSRSLILLACFIAACRTTAPGENQGFTTTDSAGTQLVINRTAAWPNGTGWQVDTTPITRIGANEGEPQQHFQYVQQARRLSDGRVVVVVGGELRWFGADGRYQRTVPRSGEGPGEFREISHLMRLGGDTLLLADWMGRKLATYTADGALIRESLLDLERYHKLGPWQECYNDVFPDGSRIGCLNDPSIPITATNRARRNGDPGPGLLRTLQRFYIVPPSLDTVHAIGLYGGLEQFGIAAASSTRFYTHPFYMTTFIAAGGTPLRIALATNPAYNIEVWTPTGRLERVIRRTNGRRAPTAADQVDVAAMMRKNLAGWHDTTSVDRVLPLLSVPDSLPAVKGLLVGPGGEIIVQREGLMPSQTASLFDVFDATGRWLGELRLPPGTRLLDIGEDYLLGVRLDANDVPLVEVFHLRRT